MTALELTKEYATDGDAFDQKYKDKEVVVEGIVTSSDAVNGEGDPLLILIGFKKEGDRFAHGVNCALGAASLDKSDLSPGSVVRVKGKCLAHSKTMSAAQMVNCHVLAVLKEPPPEPPLDGKVLPVKDDVLAKEFEKDPKAAQKTYGGQVLEVDGVVFNADRTRVTLLGTSSEGGFKGKQVGCHIASASRAKASQLSEGQRAKIKGRCEPGLDSPLLTNCELVEAGPDIAIPVTAAQITQEYAKDEAAADKKYKDKQVLIEGTVSDLRQLKGPVGTVHQVVLTGNNDKLPVEGVFPTSDKRQVAGLAKGEKIKIRGKCVGKKEGGVTLWFVKVDK